jgi:hypothetical protein
LHVSAGGVQVPPAVQEALHTWVPVDPHVVLHVVVSPARQAKPSSRMPSQSSSIPLHCSAGAAQLPHVHELPHVSWPVDAQPVVHDRMAPRTHPKPSSGVPSQSSSTPLQVSAGATHALHVQPL